MIRRKFMKFAPKEHSDEKVKKSLEKHNVPTFEGHQPAKFSQFGNMAKDLTSKARKTYETPDGGHVAPADKTFSYQQKTLYGGGTGAVHGQTDSRNPHAVVQPKGNPYASGSSQGGNPYGNSNSSNPYGSKPAAPRSDPYGERRGSDPSYAPRSGAPGSSDPYGGAYGNSAYGAPKSSANGARDGSPGTRNVYGSTSEPNAYGASGSTPGASAYGEDPGYGGGAAYGGDAGFGGDAGAPTGGAPYGAYGDSTASLNHAAIDSQAMGRRPSGFGVQQNDYGRQLHDARKRQDNGPGAYGAPAQNSDPDAFGEPLSRTRTNQSTSTTAARQELFGAAPRRANPSASEFDELNRTHTELEEDDELLASSSLDRPQYAGAMAPNPAASHMPEISEDPEDELNHLPSDFNQGGGQGIYAGDEASGVAAGTSYGTGNYAANFGAQREGDQQLFEDSEDEDVDYVKREIRQTKQESVESTRRALQIAAEAETSGRNAMGMLGDQGERLGNSAKTVALGHVQARVGERNADELQRLNRSIFIPNVSNPFNSRRRNQMKEQKLKGERRFDELEREELERQQRESEQRIADGLNGAGYGYSETAIRARHRMNRDNPERKMYQFEADSDDDALEDELDQNLDGISQAAKRLHGLSLKINDEVTDQNERIEQMGGRVDELDYSLHKSTAKMATIN